MNQKCAFLFAGQGSQYIGMGRDLYESFPESKAVFDKAGEILGFDLKGHCFNGPQELLKNTRISQPAILAVSIAAFEAFKAKDNTLKADFTAGLSLGEYSALIAAGAFSFEAGIRLVRRRSEIMEEIALRNPGKMAAVLDLPFDTAKEICLKASVEIANINAPGQVVISGPARAVDKASKLCLQAGAKRVIELEVSGGFHSSLMFEASGELRKALDSTPISCASIPVISNYTAMAQNTAAEIKENLVYQVYSPVRWEASMRYILSKGVTRFYEFGPGKVLKSLMRRIDANAQVINIEKAQDVLKYTAS